MDANFFEDNRYILHIKTSTDLVKVDVPKTYYDFLENGDSIKGYKHIENSPKNKKVVPNEVIIEGDTTILINSIK